MKKLLLCSAAALGVALSAAPAAAQIDVTVGGHSKNYVGWLDQDTLAGESERQFDMLRESEIHINAEGTADNGLTYGFHVETEVDGADSSGVEESYLYLSSNLGRVNLGSEDGANYLLQVAAPSADSNIDGIRQYINPVNYGIATANTYLTALNTGGLDYDNDATGNAEKITYLSPVWNGFQVGASYTPDVTSGNDLSGLAGFTSDEDTALVNLGDGWDAAARYEGVFNNVGFAIGAGYTHIDSESTTATFDDLQEWNVGADFDIGAFGIGAVYTENNNASDDADENETYVVGADYTTGPFQLGASYLHNENDAAGAAAEVETDRITGGVIYTAAPGLTFRGSISQVDHDVEGADDVDATSVMGGVQFNF
jgi:outer membrane protein OmpU